MTSAPTADSESQSLGNFNMWFRLLSVAAFIALGSCRGHHNFLRSEENGLVGCTGPNCPCVCLNESCPPCPLPMPVKCLTSCGTLECPCVKNESKQRAEKKLTAAKTVQESKGKVYAVSTVSAYPIGPICSGFHILPHLVVTMSSCVAGKDMDNLFVTVNDMNSENYLTEPLNVLEILVYPYSSTHLDPVVLVLEPPKLKVSYFALPPIPIDEQQPAEIQKWYVTNFGEEYTPLRTKLTSHSRCQDADRDLICASTSSETQMGWNDIGTPLVEIRHLVPIVQGIYMGHDLYKSTDTLKYLPLYQYSSWLYHVIDIYP